jgi:hypothetical protein
MVKEKIKEKRNENEKGIYNSEYLALFTKTV